MWIFYRRWALGKSYTPLEHSRMLRLRFTRAAQHKMRLSVRLHIFLLWRFLRCSCMKPWAAWSGFRADPHLGRDLTRDCLLSYHLKFHMILWQEYDRNTRGGLHLYQRWKLPTEVEWGFLRIKVLNKGFSVTVCGRARAADGDWALWDHTDSWTTTTRPCSESW